MSSSGRHHQSSRVTTAAAAGAAAQPRPPRKLDSAGSLTDSVRDCTDDTAGITRSSLTLDSLRFDSCSHTWPSSLSPSLHGVPPPAAQTTTSSASAGPRPAEVLEDADAMDVFDLALAREASLPRRSRRHRRRSHITAEAQGAAKTPLRAAVASDKAAATRPEVATGCGAHNLDEVHSAVPVASVMLPRALYQLTDTDAHMNDVLPSPPAFSTHEQKVQRVRALLHETRTLHDALWQQLCELQRAEERKQRRRSRNAA